MVIILIVILIIHVIGKWTQLQIIFEAVDRDDKYPLGVKLSYRAFVQDEVKVLKRVDNEIELELRRTANERGDLYRRALDSVDEEILVAIKSGDFTGIYYDEEEAERNAMSPGIRLGDRDPSVSVGFVPATSIQKTYDSVEANGAKVHILKNIPEGPIQPCPFIPGSASDFEKIIEGLIKKFSKDFPGMANKWQEFQRDHVPANDDVYDYIAKHPEAYHIPFKKELFDIDDDILDSGNTGEGLQRKTFDQQLKTKDTAFAEKKGYFVEEDHIYMAQPSMCFDSKKGTSASKPYVRVKKIDGADEGAKSGGIHSCW